MTEDKENEKITLIQRIRTLYAFHQFCQHKFEESMNIFVKLGTGKSWLEIKELLLRVLYMIAL